jgi:hypothetical protein
MKAIEIFELLSKLSKEELEKMTVKLEWPTGLQESLKSCHLGLNYENELSLLIKYQD